MPPAVKSLGFAPPPKFSKELPRPDPTTEFLAAAEAGLVDKVAELLSDKKADVNSRKEPLVTSVEGTPTKKVGQTALMLAARAGDEAMVDLLLEHGADANLQDPFGKTAAMYAIEFGHAEMISNKDVGKANIQDNWGHTIFHYACLFGAVSLVDDLMDETKHPELNVGEPGDETNRGSNGGQHPKMLTKKRSSTANANSNQEDGYSLAAKHGHAEVIEKILDSNRRFMIIKASRNSSANLLGPAPALLAACIHGQFIERLFEEHADELDRVDGKGFTLLMHALLRGHDKVACALIRRGVNVNATTEEHPEDGYTLMLALKHGSSPDTIALLLRKGALTGVPALTTRMEPDEIQTALLQRTHCIGYLLSEARSDSSRYKIVRLLLASAFIEQPGGALCSAVCIATSMLAHAEEVRLNDIEEYQTLESESQELGNSVGELVGSLSWLERERLFYSPEGINFLSLAAKSQRRKMLSAPPIQNHLSRRWYGDLLFAVFKGGGVYQWGGRVPISPNHQFWLTMLTVFAVVPANLILMVCFALVPPLKPRVLRWISTFGDEGIDPRIAGLEKLSGLSEATEDGGASSGYSPYLLIWYRSLLLVDVPAIKFFFTQLMSMFLLATIAMLTPCFDFDGVEMCFGTGGDSDVEQMVGAGGDFIEHAVDEFEAEVNPVRAVAGRILGGAAPIRKKKVTSSDGMNSASGEGIPVAAVWHSASWLKGLPKDGVYIAMMLFALSMLVSALSVRPSPAASLTPATALASIFMIGFFALDYVRMYDFDVQHADLQPILLAAAAFLQCIDIGRAMLLQTFICGPFVLMLFHMIIDLLVWLALTMVFVCAFGLAFYLNVVVRGDAQRAVTECDVTGTGFWNYAYLLIEVLLGLDSHIVCFRDRGDHASVTLIHLYLLIGLILLLNVLIAMMAKTFDAVRDEQELNYNYLFARIVLSAELDQGDAPPPISLLRLPSLLVEIVSRSVGGKYANLGGDFLRLPFRHKSPAELLAKLIQVDDSSDETSVIVQVHKVRSILEESDALGTKKDDEGDTYEADNYPVRVKDGFFEEASRLVFPYTDKFQHLDYQPMLQTYDKSGDEVTEPKELPVKVEHEEDGGLKKLQTRALITYAVPQTLDRVAGSALLEHAGDTYVHMRANKTYGLAHLWTTKFNDEFKNRFECTTVNTDRNIFKPQAAYEFSRTINILFGANATKICPVVYAKLRQRNDRPVYVGTSEDLEAFLRSRPDVVDQLGIAKLLPGGFVAIIQKKSKPGECDGLKAFDFSPGVEYALYTKLGWETMTMAKPLETFENECTFGDDITARDAKEDAEKMAKRKAAGMRAPSPVPFPAPLQTAYTA